MVTVITFILILGLLIFVHELGHFITARRNGIKADEFGFGFPPRIFGFIRDEKTGKFKFVPGNKEITSENTVYSVNWIPLGGFVKIKGEGGENKKDEDSFASKKAWTRIKVLAAGVLMNFLLAWILLSVVLMIGAPEAVDKTDDPKAKIQISEVLPNTPASLMGLRIGDEILKDDALRSVEDVQEYINSNRGQEIILKVKRGQEILELKGIPRQDIPAGEGSLGIGLAQTVIVKYSFFEAVWQGLINMLNLIVMMLAALYGILKNLIIGQSIGADIAGPVGIAVLTKQVTTLGLAYILQFAALLSINLGIINILPIPALDGGRILFILIEKIKGSPVTQKTEQLFHTVGFILLILLMLLITLRDVTKLFIG